MPTCSNCQGFGRAKIGDKYRKCFLCRGKGFYENVVEITEEKEPVFTLSEIELALNKILTKEEMQRNIANKLKCYLKAKKEGKG